MMPTRVIIILFVTILAILLHRTSSGPVPRPEVDSSALSKIPQWHCLRYFKHDIHQHRRCRNYRFHNLTRPRE